MDMVWISTSIFSSAIERHLEQYSREAFAVVLHSGLQDMPRAYTRSAPLAFAPFGRSGSLCYARTYYLAVCHIRRSSCARLCGSLVALALRVAGPLPSGARRRWGAAGVASQGLSLGRDFAFSWI